MIVHPYHLWCQSQPRSLSWASDILPAAKTFFKLNMEQCRQKHGCKIVFDATFTVCYDVNTIHCVLEKAKHQLNLPPIGIQEHDLEDCQITSISDACGCGCGCGCADRKLDETKHDAVSIFMI